MSDIKKEKSKWSELKVCTVFLIIVFSIFIIARYVTDEDFRSYVDVNIFKKEITDSDINVIEINSDENPYIFAYNKYINVLSKNTLTQYISTGEVANTLDVKVSIPLYACNDKYMALADKDGQKLYLISDTNIVWKATLEGSISKVSVNKNGYVSVILTNTTYKSVIVLFSPEGTEIFRKYLSTNYAICTDISDNNKYVAIGEVDYSSTIIKSYVEIISVSLAQTDSENSILNTYESESGEIITDIDYKNDDAYCMLGTYVQKVSDTENSKVYEITENDLFIDLNLKNKYVLFTKQSSGLFSYEYEIDIKSIDGKADNVYILDNSSVPKSLTTGQSLIALNFGNEVQIINSNGWLIKKYTSNTEFTDIIIGEDIVGIVYKNKIDVIDL